MEVADGLIVEVRPAGKSDQRRRAIAGHRAIPKDDEGLGALHSAVEPIQEVRSGYCAEPLNF